MYYTPSDTRERHAFIDQSVNNTLEALRIPEIAQRLGRSATHFSDAASSLVVANISDGEVQFPKQAEDSSNLPIIALRANEQLVMAPNYTVQDEAQAANTIRLFESWRPRYQTAYELFKHYAGSISLSASRPVVSMHDITVAMTGHEASLISENDLKSLFEQGPEKGIAIIKKRPCLMLKIEPGQKGTASDVLVHELVHVDIAEEKPVTVVHSQKSADMSALRVELQAYHAGSIVAGYRYHRVMQKQGDQLMPENIDSSVVQILVEAARKSMADPLDPYRPSP